MPAASLQEYRKGPLAMSAVTWLHATRSDLACRRGLKITKRKKWIRRQRRPLALCRLCPADHVP